MKLLSVGSDPEYFLQNKDGKIVSAIGKIGGTKNKPKPLKEIGKGYYIQEDNVLLEFNTPPAKNPTTFHTYHNRAVEFIKNMLAEKELFVSAKASHSMDDDELNHPRAFVFGCEPDFDVWALEWNKKPSSSDPKLRSAGGHIHIGYENPKTTTTIKLGRLLDAFVGAPLAMFDPDKKRRELYGKAGAIRFKPYGLEYRTPSNFWALPERADKVSAVYHMVRQAAKAVDMNDNDFLEHMTMQAKLFLDGETDSYDLDTLSQWCGYNVKTLLKNGSLL
jgi:hypothetical protein